MTQSKYITFDSFLAEDEDIMLMPDRPVLLAGRGPFKPRKVLLGQPAILDPSYLNGDLDNVTYSSMLIEFPSDFSNSTKEKFLQVIKVTVLQFDRTTQPTRILKNDNIIVCSDLVQEAAYCDHFLCFANQTYTEDKVIPIYNAKKPFNIILRDEELRIIDLDPAGTRVVLEFKLMY
jgi:hypothetical protein